MEKDKILKLAVESCSYISSGRYKDKMSDGS
jgi:hypothetical protein